MSYCRFSSNDYQCDVYVYESEGGWEIHVAGNRFAFKEPLPEHIEWSQENAEVFFDRMRRVRSLVDEAERIEITLEHAGDSFTEGSAIECADRLEYLQRLGYVVPQYVIDELREEAA